MRDKQRQINRKSPNDISKNRFAKGARKMIKIPTDVLCRRSPCGWRFNEPNARHFEIWWSCELIFYALSAPEPLFATYKPVECCDPRFHIFLFVLILFRFLLCWYFSGRWNEFIACANFVLKSFDRCRIKFGDGLMALLQSLSGAAETCLHNQLTFLPPGLGRRTAYSMTLFIQLCAISFAIFAEVWNA